MSQDASWLVLVSYSDPGTLWCNNVAGTSDMCSSIQCSTVPVLLGCENLHPLPAYLTVTNLPPPSNSRITDNTMEPSCVGKCLYLFLNELITVFTILLYKDLMM